MKLTSTGVTNEPPVLRSDTTAQKVADEVIIQMKIWHLDVYCAGRSGAVGLARTTQEVLASRYHHICSRACAGPDPAQTPVSP